MPLQSFLMVILSLDQNDINTAKGQVWIKENQMTTIEENTIFLI